MTAGRRGVTEQAASAAIEQACRMLRLPTMRDRFTEIAAAAEREQLSYLGFLAELVMAECDDRDRRRAARRVREAGFPRPKRLEEFSFDANPAVSPAVIGQLATCGWVKAGHVTVEGKIDIYTAPRLRDLLTELTSKNHYQLIVKDLGDMDAELRGLRQRSAGRHAGASLPYSIGSPAAGDAGPSCPRPRAP